MGASASFFALLHFDVALCLAPGLRCGTSWFRSFSFTLADAWLGFVLAMLALVLLFCCTKLRITKWNFIIGGFTYFTFYFIALARNFNGLSIYTIKNLFPTNLIFFNLANTKSFDLVFISPSLFHPKFLFLFLLFSVPGYILKDSYLFVSGLRYYLETLCLYSAFLTYLLLYFVVSDPIWFIYLL